MVQHGDSTSLYLNTSLSLTRGTNYVVIQRQERRIRTAEGGAWRIAEQLGNSSANFFIIPGPLARESLFAFFRSAARGIWVSPILPHRPAATHRLHLNRRCAPCYFIGSNPVPSPANAFDVKARAFLGGGCFLWLERTLSSLGDRVCLPCPRGKLKEHA